MLQTLYTKLQRIAERAKDKTVQFIQLNRHISPELLRAAYDKTRKDGAAGVSGTTAKDYEEKLEVNLQGLYERVRAGQYWAPPIKRAWIPKEDGSRRPLGIPEFEDKVLQRAIMMLLEPIYEQDFYECSFGFRPGKSAHDALREIRQKCITDKIQWILDVDIRKYFDSIKHGQLLEVMQRRVKDGGVLRLVGKWLNAGVFENGKITNPESGTPQGGVISPLLANIYLHEVLDEWIIKTVQPRMRGKIFLVRYADDFVIGCAEEEDAKRIMEVLPKRMARFGLEINIEKSRVVNFGRPKNDDDNPGTFAFLGFTHYWGRTRKGGWTVKRQTAAKRYARAKRAIWAWCKSHRHLPVSEQWTTLSQKLRGYYQYYAIRCNLKHVERIWYQCLRAWRYWLSRRSNRSVLSWEKFSALLAALPLPSPRIVHNEV
jgi:group II intron reverse transcriptase/maturase